MPLTIPPRRFTFGWLMLAPALLALVAPASGETSRPAPEILTVGRLPLGRATVVSRSGAIVAALARFCGTSAPSTGDAETVGATLACWREEHVPGTRGGTIQVAFHVITARGVGDVTDAHLEELVRALDRDHAASGYRFALGSVDRIDEPGWLGMTPGSSKERTAKEALAIDPARRLNIYVCGLASGLRGWAQYPWSAAEGHALHGVVLDPSVVAGDAADDGRTASHEVGHYLGLLDAVDGVGATAPAERMREVVSVYRPSLFTAAPAPPARGRSEIPATEGAEPEDGRVLAYRGAHPNPFHSETALRFTLPSSQQVSLRVYSVTGQLVRTLVDAALPPGDHSAMFRAGDLPSGAYFAVLKAGSVQMSRTLMLIR